MDNSENISDAVMSIIVLFSGILLIVVSPYLILSGLKHGITDINMVNGESLKIQLAHKSIMQIYPILNDICLMIGTALLVLTIPIYKSGFWSKSIAIGMLGTISIVGAFLIETVPYLSDQLISNGIILLFIGLIPCFIILYIHNQSTKYRLIRLLLYFFIIISVGSNLFGSFEFYLQRQATLQTSSEVNQWNFFGVYSNFISGILTIIALPLLAAHKKEGFWIISYAMLMMSISSFVFLTISSGHPHMILFLPVAILPLITLVLLNIVEHFSASRRL